MAVYCADVASVQPDSPSKLFVGGMVPSALLMAHLSALAPDEKSYIASYLGGIGLLPRKIRLTLDLSRVLTLPSVLASALGTNGLLPRNIRLTLDLSRVLMLPSMLASP